MADIGAAGIVFIISVPLILPVPVQLQGFAVDDIFDIDEVDATDTMQGVDGILSAGMVFNPTPQNIKLQADSPSNAFFEAWDSAQQSNVAAYPAQANATFIGIGRNYQLSTGWLRRVNRMPSAKKLLQPRTWRIEWQRVLAVPVGIAG